MRAAWSSSKRLSQLPRRAFAAGRNSVTLSPPLLHQVRAHGAPSIWIETTPLKLQP
jgi:hypothetical protein